LATAIAESIGGQAVVFNPAGVHNRTLERNASEQASSSQIFSFVVDGEILTELQKKANGYVAGVRYSVVPEAKEQVIELKPSTKFSINPATEATQRHSMCAVLLGLLELYEK
jgi:hypothetical protein